MIAPTVVDWELEEIVTHPADGVGKEVLERIRVANGLLYRVTAVWIKPAVLHCVKEIVDIVRVPWYAVFAERTQEESL